MLPFNRLKCWVPESVNISSEILLLKYILQTENQNRKISVILKNKYGNRQTNIPTFPSWNDILTIDFGTFQALKQYSKLINVQKQ